jgi:uncharacterized membrane protein YeaQ/YmgE (transglycosylase-associated protein family)
MSSVLGWIVLGGLAGAIASYFSDSDHGCLMNVLLGIIGAVLGGVIFKAFGGAGVTGCNLWSLMVATVGALLILALGRAFSGRRRYR